MCWHDLGWNAGVVRAELRALRRLKENPLVLWLSPFSCLSVFQLLCEEWASYGVFYKYQPIDLVRWEFSPRGRVSTGQSWSSAGMLVPVPLGGCCPQCHPRGIPESGKFTGRKGVFCELKCADRSHTVWKLAGDIFLINFVCSWWDLRLSEENEVPF